MSAVGESSRPDHFLWQVAVDAPIPTALTYSCPVELQSQMQAGQAVTVPLGKRRAQGVLLGQRMDLPEHKVKDIIGLTEAYSPLAPQTLKWLQWMADYYLHPVGSTIGLAFPPLAKAKVGAKPRKSKAISVVDSLQDAPSETQVRQLTKDQERVIEEIFPKNSARKFAAHLLFGVTGSGKTEVYLQLLQKVLLTGKKAIILVPEIALTPQLIQRFTARFGSQVAVLHSQMSERERTNHWWDIVENRKTILIGARSALFCPIVDLGLIVVDEEHEPSYKQDEKLKYHGRDAAVMLAKQWECPIILGSATPSLETWKNAQEGRYQLHRLTTRVEDRALPEIQVVDLRDKTNPEKQKDVKASLDLPHWMSQQLYDGIQLQLDRGEQAALFLNRRGAAALVICPDCGFTHKCPNCDINLTLHGHVHLVCHYCDYHENLREACPDCRLGILTPVGLGTESLETELQRLFPAARLARADRDEITSRDELVDLIQRMENREIDLLIGTQMIAKGLDFPGLNFVGVVLADIGFNIPDFRATERSFQLLTQVAGRSGRHQKQGENPGQVLIQTYNTEHPSLQFALKHDYVGFATQELANRQVLNYPPVGRLLAVRIQGNSQNAVAEAARLFADRGHQLQQKLPRYQEIEVLGPAAAPIAKLRGKYRYHLLLKGLQAAQLNAFCRHILGNQDWVASGIRFIADVDPLHLL